MQIETLYSTKINDSYKGIPGGILPFKLSDIKKQDWNILAQDLPLPVLVLKQEALENNINFMKKFIHNNAIQIAPHGKTSMAPQLFAKQLSEGAWGLTCATVSQLQIYRRFGVKRVLLANQLVGKANIEYVLSEINRDNNFDFYCLVDSIISVHLLDQAIVEKKIDRPLQVFLEVGLNGGRTGCRTLEQAITVAQAIEKTNGRLLLRGVEGFEGLIPAQDVAAVIDFIDFIKNTADACLKRNLFAKGPVFLSAGGSVFYDLVVKGLLDKNSGYEIVLRSGCYLAHDSGIYKNCFAHIQKRNPELLPVGPGLLPTLELWCYIQSMPQLDLAVLTMGKRDVGFDAGFPITEKWFRPGKMDKPQKLDMGYEIYNLFDQHAYLRIPENSPLQVGDMIACGISHPCTTLDKWRLVQVVDDAYQVVDGILTFF